MEKCKKQWSQAKIFLLRNSKGTGELFLALSEETEDADSSWHRHLQMLALNSANYLDICISRSFTAFFAVIHRQALPSHISRPRYGWK